MKLKNIEKCKKEINLIVIGIIQIFILITLIPSNSYFIAQSNDLIENTSIANNKNKGNFSSNLINLLTRFLSIKQIGVVSAQEDDSEWCCEILKSNGATCQPISAGEGSLCSDSGQIWMTDCQSTTLCKTGTCIDEEYGTCSAGPKKDCENWNPLLIYEIPECKSGCCILDEGTKKEWGIKLKCDNEAGSFDDNIPQSGCKVLTEEMGACVLDNNNCIFTTEEDCVNNLEGNPWKGLLCSNPNLNTICGRPKTKTEIQTTCYNDKVYFLDNCSNIANVYDFDKWDVDDYWKFVQTSACDAISDPTTCGNCDGTNNICASSSEAGIIPAGGDYVCKDIRCDFDGDGTKEKQSSESICVYEGYIGYSRDVVGSAHIRKICSGGEIIYDICDVYRGEICGYETANDGSSIARCRKNEGIKCLAANKDEIKAYEYNDDNELINEEDTLNENNKACAETSPDCRLESIDVDDYFKFDACVPKYPPGFDLTEPSNEGNYKKRCDIATQTCTTVWKKGIINWNCKKNCECLTKEFANQMNDLCISLGDCGGYVNIEGQYTDDGFETFNGNELPEDYDEEVTLVKPKYKVTADGDISQSKKNEYISYANIGNGDFPSYFSGAEKGYFGGIDGLEFEIEDIKDAAIWYDIGAGVLIGIPATIGLSQIGAAIKIVEWIAGTTFPPALIIFIVIEFIIIVLVELFGWGEIEEYDVKFECKPWQPPSGGNDCDVCNENPETCTEYKCESLGAGCELINKYELYDSEVNVCHYSFKNDHTEAEIVNHSISSGYKFVNLVSVPGDMAGGIKIEADEQDGCIEESSQINFSLKTINPNKDGEDEYAKCAWSWERVDPDPTDDYRNVPQGEDFKESPYYSIEHTFEARLPFVSSLNPQDISGNTPGERTGELNMYIRCKDKGDNFNFDSYVVNFCIKEGPDNKISTITEFIPEDKSFLAYDETTKLLIISLDEPAECNWTLGTDKPIEDMEKFSSCTYDEAHPELGGTCKTTLTGLTQSTNNIYIKCKDQPWICDGSPEDGCYYTGPWKEENRNVNTQGFPYTLYATPNPLNITSISPQGTVEIGGTVSEIFLEATTTGGMDNGISVCKYLFFEAPSEITSGDFFSQTGSTVHKQPFSPPTGDYNILVGCKDEAGNKATGNAVFNLIKDSEFPKAVRVYKSGSNLKLITDEQASCYYSFKNCRFDFNDENINSMTTAYSTEHTANWNTVQKYYIKCKDMWGNSGCSIIISLA